MSKTRMGFTMPYNEAQKRAVKKYNQKAYDNILLRLKKGNKSIIQEYAKSNNETVNGMINRLLEDKIPAIKNQQLLNSKKP